MATAGFSYIFHPLDSSLSSGERYIPFEPLGPALVLLLVKPLIKGLEIFAVSTSENVKRC